FFGWGRRPSFGSIVYGSPSAPPTAGGSAYGSMNSTTTSATADNREELEALKREEAELRSERDALLTKLANADAKLAAQKRDLEVAGAAGLKLQEDVAAVRRALTEARAERDAANDKVYELEREARSQANAMIDLKLEHQEEMLDANEKLAAVSADADAADAAARAAKDTIRKLNTELESLHDTNDKLKCEAEDARSAMADLKAKLEAAHSAACSSQSSLALARAAEHALKAELETARTRIAELEAASAAAGEPAQESAPESSISSELANVASIVASAVDGLNGVNSGEQSPDLSVLREQFLKLSAYVQTLKKKVASGGSGGGAGAGDVTLQLRKAKKTIKSLMAANKVLEAKDGAPNVQELCDKLRIVNAEKVALESQLEATTHASRTAVAARDKAEMKKKKALAAVKRRDATIAELEAKLSVVPAGSPAPVPEATSGDERSQVVAAAAAAARSRLLDVCLDKLAGVEAELYKAKSDLEAADMQIGLDDAYIREMESAYKDNYKHLAEAKEAEIKKLQAQLHAQDDAAEFTIVRQKAKISELELEAEAAAKELVAEKAAHAKEREVAAAERAARVRAELEAKLARAAAAAAAAGDGGADENVCDNARAERVGRERIRDQSNRERSRSQPRQTASSKPASKTIAPMGASGMPAGMMRRRQSIDAGAMGMSPRRMRSPSPGPPGGFMHRPRAVSPHPVPFAVAANGNGTSSPFRMPSRSQYSVRMV
ncbi:uncharacterized protein AMSG_11551, partial [Thecamonas trahens ATCC 50062]